MICRARWCFLLVWGLSLPALANAAIVFDVDAPFALNAQSAFVNGGQSGQITGFLNVTDGDVGATSLGWQGTLQVTAGGGATLADITLSLATDNPALVTLQNDIWASGVTASGPTNQQNLGTFDLSGAKALLARTDLFGVNFTISPTAPAGGTFSFDIISQPPFSTQVLGLGGSFAQSPEFTLTVVPEPSTLAFSVLALVAGGLGYRRRRNAAAARS